MSKKKSIVISVGVVVLFIVLVFSITYAYLVVITNEESVDAGSGMLDINYDAPDDITGSFVYSTNRERGLVTTASASLKTGSEVAILSMYITPTVLTNLNISALKWEAEGVRNGEIVCSGTGDFNDAVVNEPIKLFVNDINDDIDDCILSTDITNFNIYVWLDVNLVDTPLYGTNFSAKITADSVPITGEF